jgi:hypothetical protein
MRRLILLTATLIGLAFIASGCMTAGRLAKELAKDDATAVVDITSIYGRARIVRSNPKPGHSVTVMPDGMVTITAETK